MTISYYGGLPGSGKSYSLVKRVIVPALSMQRKIITNIPLQKDLIDKDFPDNNLIQLERGKENIIDIALLFLIPKFDDELNKQEAKKRYIALDVKARQNISFEIDTDNAGAVLILDELLFYLPAGLSANKIDKSVKDLLAMHRHITDDKYSMEIYFCSQDSSQIAPFVRSLIEQSFIVRKNSVGKKSFLTVTKYSGCYGETTGASKQTELGKSEDTFNPQIQKYYQSQTYGNGQVDEFKTVDETNLLKQSGFKYLIASLFLIPFTFYLVYTTINDMYFNHDKKQQVVESKVIRGTIETKNTVEIKNGETVTKQEKIINLEKSVPVPTFLEKYKDWDFYYTLIDMGDNNPIINFYIYGSGKQLVINANILKKYKVNYELIGDAFVISQNDIVIIANSIRHKQKDDRLSIVDGIKTGL